jgi:hypothetical protein
MIREAFARSVLASACLVALLGIACPKPGPAPVSPDASDAASPALDAAKPRAATCSAACAHLIEVPCAVRRTVCSTTCEKVRVKDPGYPGCVLAATNCAAADACDHGR